MYNTLYTTRLESHRSANLFIRLDGKRATLPIATVATNKGQFYGERDRKVPDV
jgi:hypothetical protein